MTVMTVDQRHGARLPSEQEHLQESLEEAALEADRLSAVGSPGQGARSAGQVPVDPVSAVQAAPVEASQEARVAQAVAEFHQVVLELAIHPAGVGRAPAAKSGYHHRHGHQEGQRNSASGCGHWRFGRG